MYMYVSTRGIQFTYIYIHMFLSAHGLKCKYSDACDQFSRYVRI